MATPDDSAVDTARTSTVDRLTTFLEEHTAGDIPYGEDWQRDVAEAVLRDFFVTDVEADQIYAIARVDVETRQPFVTVHWGPMVGRLEPLELRLIAANLLEVAETAEVESLIVRWLLSEPGSTIDGAVKILESFREYRTRADLEPGQ